MERYYCDVLAIPLERQSRIFGRGLGPSLRWGRAPRVRGFDIPWADQQATMWGKLDSTLNVLHVALRTGRSIQQVHLARQRFEHLIIHLHEDNHLVGQAEELLATVLDQENERCISVAELKPCIRQFEQLPADTRFILLKTVGFIQKRMASRALSCSMKRFNDWVEAAGGTKPGILVRWVKRSDPIAPTQFAFIEGKGQSTAAPDDLMHLRYDHWASKWACFSRTEHA